MAGSSLPRGINSGPRVVSRANEDEWSTFPNPGCDHEQYCGVSRPEDVGSDENVPQNSNSPTGTKLCFPKSHPPRFRISHTDSLYLQAGVKRESMEAEENDSALPSKVGPFLLKSLSSGSIVEGCEYCFALLERPIHRVCTMGHPLNTSIIDL